ncbi:U-box domain-containing protein 24-like [Panicum virgatum]|uniref:U-box domain-containing protein 24-like n=1 Tax=Panicum virgatum TaxID=38727 RepID=UPI0019D5D307|nr:U-box domain-containing protein 24-like [Panicum virgatum]
MDYSGAGSGGDSELEDDPSYYYQEPEPAFMCPLTKQVMHDPVTIETGHTFEREAILKWFRECRDSGRTPTWPLTQAELRTADTSPSLALRNVIHEWRARNQDKELEKAKLQLQSQSQSQQDDDALRALGCISHVCRASAANKNLVRRQGIIPAVAASSRAAAQGRCLADCPPIPRGLSARQVLQKARLKSLELLRLVVDNDDTSDLDAVLLYSAMALEKLSLQSGRLTAVPEPAPRGKAKGLLLMCRACLRGGTPPPPGALGTCRGGCKAVERLVACLEHADERVVEAALAALSTLVGDGVADAAEGVLVVSEAEGLRPVVEVLVENRTEALRRRAVWAVERILRVEDIAQEVAADQTMVSALVEAYRNGDARTRQTAELALRHLDRIPNFSSSAFHQAKARPRQ